MMAIQQKSQSRGWRHLLQRASNILRRITKRQGELQKQREKTQKREAGNGFLQPKDNVYPRLARGTNFIHENETPFQVSNNKNNSIPFELELDDIYLNLARNRRGLIVNPDLANSLYVVQRRAEQYTVRPAISSRRSYSLRDSASTGHDQQDICLSSPLLNSSAGMRLEALADELLLSLGVRPSPAGSEQESRDGLASSQSDVAEDLESCAYFEGFSDRFSFSKPATMNSIISSYSPTQTAHRGREGSTMVDFSFFPELRRWVQKHGSSWDRLASTHPPRAKCEICKASNLEIRELGNIISSSTTGDETEKATVLPCGHMFGKDCLASWRSANEDGFSCPTCRSSLIFSSCGHTVPGLTVGRTADVPLTSPEGGRIPTHCNDCRLSKIQNGCVELARLIYDDFEYTEGECRRAAWCMVPLAVEAAQRATVERVMGSRGWGNTEVLGSG
ncbi:hypothetical protein PpBr36_07965 [Pyricularia pennisetigena]|uniref:hypothetical protein n=1 Tax=Pyricularia pennisetigena TaxID=1578925 RepID=UPI00114F0568|nr:hypothetical protein PpBr36_07965 [Pyricularia pennisetigena]TLS25680.1 hypothetical protein PpBr36_07965 [Pyricularia pennisetigena]